MEIRGKQDVTGWVDALKFAGVGPVGECYKCAHIVAGGSHWGRPYVVKRIGIGKPWERDVFICECCEVRPTNHHA